MKYILLFLVFLGGCSLASLQDDRSEIIFTPSPAFSTLVSARGHFYEKAPHQIVVHIDEVRISHNDYHDRRTVFVSALKLNVHYYDESEFCYISSGQQRCKPPEWRYGKAGPIFPVNKILFPDEPIQLEDVVLEYDLAAYEIASSRPIEFYLSAVLDDGRSSVNAVSNTISAP